MRAVLCHPQFPAPVLPRHPWPGGGLLLIAGTITLRHIRARADARLVGRPVRLALPVDEPLFTVSRDFVKILDRDLAAAGIPKQDERGRTVDIHALRHTFGTHLSKNGVAPRTAQAAIRPS